MPLTGLRRQLALKLYEVGAIKFGAFTLKLHEKNPEAPKSPIYLMLRGKNHPKNPGPVTDEIMYIVGDLYDELIEDGTITPFDRYVDLPEAGTPFGDQMERVIDELNDLDSAKDASRLHVTKVVREDGSRYIAPGVHGFFETEDTCLAIDDMVTGADTKLEAIKVLRDAGLTVEQVLVTVDREQGATKQLKAVDVELVAVLKLSNMLDLYVEEGLLDAAKAQEVREYIASNQVA